MLAVDGATLSKVMAGAFVVTIAIVLLMLGFAAACAVAGIRTVRAAPGSATRWQRIGGVASIALAVILVLGVGSMSWSWVRYYLDGKEADRASTAAARVAQMCESQFYGLHSTTGGHPYGFVSEPATTAGEPPKLVSHDDWVAGCVVRNGARP